MVALAPERAPAEHEAPPPLDASVDCWLWLGAADARGHALHVRRSALMRGVEPVEQPARWTAYEWLLGPAPRTPTGRRVTTTMRCGRAACIAPHHLVRPATVNHERATLRRQHKEQLRARMAELRQEAREGLARDEAYLLQTASLGSPVPPLCPPPLPGATPRSVPWGYAPEPPRPEPPRAVVPRHDAGGFALEGAARADASASFDPYGHGG